MYKDRLKDILAAPERLLLKRLSTPQRIQDYLDTLSINFETRGETYMSPRRVIESGTPHCFEGALLAAAAQAYHGQTPLLMDFRTVPTDEDHVVTLFKQNGLWGAISKTNHAQLRYLDPLYRTPRELAMTFFHEYLEWNGKKSLRAYSAPFDLSKYAPQRWVTEKDELFWLVDALDDSRHFAVAPKKNLRFLRKAASVELHAMKTTEWSKRGRLIDG